MHMRACGQREKLVLYRRSPGVRAHVLRLLSVLLLAGAATSSLVAADETGDLLKLLSRTGPNGVGSDAARKACDQLAGRGVEILPQLLQEMDTPNPIAANWCRSVYEQIVARELQKKTPELPRELFRQAVQDSRKQGKLRRLILELLDQLEPDFGKQLLPTLVDDPEFRDDAINLVLQQGDRALVAGQKPAARLAFHRAFKHARTPAQVHLIAGKLSSVGEKADVISHLGLIVDWYLVGPFDAPGTTGYRMQFPPESKIDLKEEFSLPMGKKLTWQRYRNTSPTGDLDLTKAIQPIDEAVAFAYTELALEPSRPVPAAQVRCGADDNCTVWINGERVFGRDQWLNSSRPDRFITRVKLRSGKNTVLVKICQGPHHVDPTIGNNWSLQIRICDPSGLGVNLKSMLPEQ